MRRTYKSKKDTGGTLDYKDMLCNMDEKSSAFDAFYIQNIKQTKREQSCMGSSNNHGAASNRVRKRKYVKRLIKDVEPSRRESLRGSISESVFLTPDKSIRVNKAPDLFDQLLNSSPACSEEKQAKKVDLFDHIRVGTPKKTKTYNRKKKLLKKFSYSSNESSVSDKEDSNKNKDNSTQNTTDVKAHKLIIEKESAASPILDESINNIVRKLSLLNNINHKGSSGCLKKTFKCNRNRLTKNFQSPLVNTSPLSSTPFTDKTRSKSIYKFSPIPMGDLYESPQNLTEIDDNEANKSIVFVPKIINNALKKSHDEESPVTPIFHYSKKGSSNPLFSSETDTQENVVKNTIVNNVSKDKNSSENPVSVQLNLSTEMKQFINFSENPVAKVENKLNIVEEKDDSIIISTGKSSKNSQKSKEFIIENETGDVHAENINISIIEYSVTPEPFFGFTKQSNSIIDISNANDSLPSQPFLGFSEVRNSYNEKEEHVSQNSESDTESKSVVNVIYQAENDVSTKTKLYDVKHKISKIVKKDHCDSVINISVAPNEMPVEPVSTEFTLERDRIFKCIDEPIMSQMVEYIAENEISRNTEVYDVTPKINKIVDSDDDDDNDFEEDKRSTNNISAARNNIFVVPVSTEVTPKSDKISKTNDDDYEITQNEESDKDISIMLSSFSSVSEQNNQSDRENSDELQDDNDDMESSRSFQMQENEYDDKKSLYDTCNSDTSSLEEISQKEPVVTLKRMDMDLFRKYYDNMTPNHSAEPKVAIERMNIDLFKKYYKNMPNYNEDEELTERELSENGGENYASFDDSDYVPELSEQDNQSANTDRDITSIEDGSDSSAQDISSESRDVSIEEKCINFVTTRKKNDFTNNSDILILDDSQASASTGCDITVLSNNKISLASPKTDLKNTDVSVNNDSISKVEECAETDSYESKSPDARVSNVTTRNSKLFKFNNAFKNMDISKTADIKSGIILQPGKRWERSLSIYRRMTMNDHLDHSILEDEEDLQTKGRKYRQSVICTMEMQENSLLHNESIHNRRSTFVSKPSRSTIRIVKETNTSRLSLSSTAVFEDLKGFLEDCDDTIVELSKLSLVDDHDVTVIEKLHESSRNTTARDYVLRRCNQSDTIPFDECYPDPLLKNCRKIGEGVYGEVYLWRAPDGRARVMKVVPIAGTVRVNGERQKDFHEIIAEIVIAMELSALRAPIADIECHFTGGKDVDTLDLHSVENATDVFNEVLAVRCVYGSYSPRLLDLWELYDETVGSENDNPAILPVDQQYIVLELANAGQDLESFQFNSAEQAYALFQQVAFALAVGEESFQFEHRDLHWGNVLIAPTDQKYATFILRGRCHRVPRRGVAATIIDYSLSRVSVNLGAREQCALYNDLAADEGLFTALGDYQFQVYRLMRDKLGNDWKNFEPYTNILWLHYTVDKMITALRYKRTTTKTHKQYINKLKGIKERLLSYGSAAQFVLTDNEFY